MPRYSDAQRERWAALQRDADRRRRRGRILLWACVGVLVLGGAGWFAKPKLTEYAVESSACDGALRGGMLDTARAVNDDRPLAEESSRTDNQLGRYTCEVRDEKGNRVVAVQAYTGRDDVDAGLSRDFRKLGGRPVAALPGGLPGFESRMRGIVLMPPCPGRGKDVAGQPGRLLVNVDHVYMDTPHRMLRVATTLANKASEKLGCRSKALPVPPESVQPQTVRPSGTAGTACAALARGPLQGAGWTVDVRAPKGPGPMVSCALRPSGTGEEGESKETLVELNAWYGDWSTRMLLDSARHRGTWGGPDHGARPWLTAKSGWAMARCDGRAAAFQLSVSREDEDGDRDPEEWVDGKAFTTGEMRRVLVSFAEEQSAKRGCQGLRLPAATAR